MIWSIKFPQSRYGYFSYVSCLFFYISYRYFNLGEINKKSVKIFFSILLIFLSTKNILRIHSEIKNNNNNINQYPIKKFKSDDYTVKLIDNIKKLYEQSHIVVSFSSRPEGFGRRQRSKIRMP